MKKSLTKPVPPGDAHSLPVELTDACQCVVTARLTQPTYAQLVEIVADVRRWSPGSSSFRNWRSLVRTWCRYFDETLESLASPTLGRDDFEGLLTQVTDEIAKARGRSNAANNIRSAVRELKRTFDKVKRNGDLPLDFKEAFCVALKRISHTPHSLAIKLEANFGYSKFVRSTLMRYAAGSIHPQKKKAFPLISHIEQALDLEIGTLTSRAFKQAQPIMLGSGLPIPYRENLAVQTARPYKLKQFPPSLLSVWLQIVAWRTQATVRIGDLIFTKKPGEYWAKSATVLKVEGVLLYFFGFLCLPQTNATTPSSLLTRDERATRGKGMTVDEIEIANLFDTNLLLDYFDFLRARNAENKYSVHAINMLSVLSSWVNSPSSFFNAHPQYSELFVSLNPEGKSWGDLLNDIHQKLLRLKRQLARAIDGTSRDPGEPLRQVFEDKDPYGLFLELAKRMRVDLPPRVQKMSHATAFRNLVIVSTQMEVPLRARNVIELEVGKTIFRDEKSGLWTVEISKSALKNHHSRHAKNIHRPYSRETSRLLDEYWTVERQNLRDPLLSKVLFIPSAKGKARRRKELDRHGLSHADLYMLIYSITARYFGVGIGSNVFRHLFATGILKQDSSRYGAAAAVLNNSEEMIRQNYSHINQQDELRTAGNWRQEQVDNFEVAGGKASPSKK